MIESKLIGKGFLETCFQKVALPTGALEHFSNSN